MEIRRFVRLIATVSFLVAGVYVMVFRENEVEYNEVYDITAVDHEFYPGAYEFYHELHNNPDKHRPAFETLLSHNRQYHRYNSEVLDSIHFDFQKYSYLVVYGAKIKRMYWNYITTTFEDESPSYCCARRYGRQFVKIEYQEPDGKIYLYRLKHDDRLTVFQGL